MFILDTRGLILEYSVSGYWNMDISYLLGCTVSLEIRTCTTRYCSVDVIFDIDV